MFQDKTMNQQLAGIKRSKGKQGFTLVETVIAMGIITIMITAFLAAFGPAVKGIRKSLSVKEINRMATALEYEMTVLRPGVESTDYDTAFEKSFEWIKKSASTSNSDMILLYQYRGDSVAAPNTDGTLSPFVGADGIPGKDYVIQSVVRRFNNTLVVNELKPGVVEGRVFLIRMSQLIYSTSGELIDTTNPNEILDPYDPHAAKDYAGTDPSKTYAEATIAFKANFYLLKSNNSNYINNLNVVDDTNNDGHPDSLGKPVFVRNLAVRR